MQPAMQPRGKRPGRSPVINSVTGSHLYAFDQLSGRRFLIDTGAELSICPPSPQQLRMPQPAAHQHQVQPTLVAANGTPIRVYGNECITFTLDKRTYMWQFVNADVPRPILGADFLRAHTLLVDLHNRRLIDMQYLATTALHPSDQECIQLNCTSTPNNSFICILQDYPDITTPLARRQPSKHGVRHHIPTTGAPVHARARRLPPDKLALAKAEFRTMEDLGIVCRSASPWSSPLHLVPKSSGGHRPCRDYRRLNAQTL